MQTSLHILTRAYRYHLLPHVGASIKAALREFSYPWTWWIACDEGRTADVPGWAKAVPCGPQADPWATDRFRALLGMVDDGFVYGLDDDNAMHPRFSAAFTKCVESHDGFCMPQEMRVRSIFQKVLRRIAPNLKTHPSVYAIRPLEQAPRIEHIDLAQYVLKRNLIGDIAWKGGVWDGEIIQEAFVRYPGKIFMWPEPACYYNYCVDFPRPWWWEGK